MIIDLPKFIANEKPYWSQLDEMIKRLEENPNLELPLPEVRQFHYLYERASADLVKLNTFASEPELRRYLESLISRAYSEIHESRRRDKGLELRRWLAETFPQTFRKQIRAFWLAVAITMAGTLFGVFATLLDPDSRYATMPFGHDQMRPRERVAMEEKAQTDRMAGAKSTFSGYLMTHNTKVSILTMALGMSYGVGTVALLFYNGISLGSISADYITDGQLTFLLGWLLPHGVIEIPAILVAGQAGLVLAGALIGRGRRAALRARLRQAAGDLTTLIFGAGLLLVWAGLIEAFLSQYHEPVIPYWLKIVFGLTELAVLVLYLARAGKTPSASEANSANA